MSNLLAASVTESNPAMVWVFIIIGVVAAIEIAVFIIMLASNRKKSATVAEPLPEPERKLWGIAADTAVVKRNFTVGEQFNCEGLVVKARYNLPPVSQSITDYAVFTDEQLKELKESGEELPECYVVQPDMSTEGKRYVKIVCFGLSDVYAVSVNKEIATAPAAYTANAVHQKYVAHAEPAAHEIGTYEITVTATDKLKALYVVLVNGKKRATPAVRVVDGMAKIVAPVGDYMVELVGLPDEYEVNGELVSAVKRVAELKVKKNSD